MIKLEINNKKYKVPKRFTISQWEQLMSWDLEEPRHWPKILEIAVGVPMNESRLADPDGIALAVGFVVTTMSEREPTQIEFKDLGELNFGQFVDNEVYISMGIDKNLGKMMETLGYEVEWANDAIQIVEEYVKWRTSIFREYKTLFGLSNKDFEEWSSDKEDVDPMSTARGWYKIIVELANDNLLDIDAVTDQPLKKVLNFMALNKEKQLAAAEAARQQRNKQRR